LQTVHTTGVNWVSVITIITGVVVIVGAFTGYIGTRITNAVNNLSDTLQLKLETKERVNEMDNRLSVVEVEVRQIDIRRR
jgi:predicted PurR-regulated permease PerM